MKSFQSETLPLSLLSILGNRDRLFPFLSVDIWNSQFAILSQVISFHLVLSGGGRLESQAEPCVLHCVESP